MTTPQPIEEIMARAFYTDREEYFRRNRLVTISYDELPPDALERERKATRAALQALQEAGYAVVPTSLLTPFAEAAGDLDDHARPTDGLWESPAAMNLTAGDLRNVAAMLQHSPTQEGAK